MDAPLHARKHAASLRASRMASLLWWFRQDAPVTPPHTPLFCVLYVVVVVVLPWVRAESGAISPHARHHAGWCGCSARVGRVARRTAQFQRQRSLHSVLRMWKEEFAWCACVAVATDARTGALPVLAGHMPAPRVAFRGVHTSLRRAARGGNASLWCLHAFCSACVPCRPRATGVLVLVSGLGVWGMLPRLRAEFQARTAFSSGRLRFLNIIRGTEHVLAR